MRSAGVAQASRPWVAAVVGAALVLPFLLLNLVVVHRLDPLFSLLRPGPHTGPLEYPILFTVLLLLPVGAVIALVPVWRAVGARRRVPPLNLAVAVLLTATFVLLTVELGGEIVRCDVIGVANCD